MYVTACATFAVVGGGVAAAAIVRVKLRETVAAVPVLLSVAVIVKVPVPAVVGVPLRAPLLLPRLNPGGREPVVTTKVYGARPPLAVRLAEYDEPAVAWGNVDGDRTIVGAVTVILTVAAEEVPPPFVAV